MHLMDVLLVLYPYPIPKWVYASKGYETSESDMFWTLPKRNVASGLGFAYIPHESLVKFC